MSQRVFMSPEHVAAMNAILDGDASVRAACAELKAATTLGYTLSDGPDGRTVHWRMTFTDTVRFSLDDTRADFVLTGDWARMVRSVRAKRQGRTEDPGVEFIGDLDVWHSVGKAFGLACEAATLPVEFPDV